MEHKPPATGTPSGADPAAPQTLESPLKPLMWVLVPFIALIVYGVLSG